MVKVNGGGREGPLYIVCRLFFMSLSAGCGFRVVVTKDRPWSDWSAQARKIASVQMAVKLCGLRSARLFGGKGEHPTSDSVRTTLGKGYW
jgi:hypothetical protein